MPCSIMKRTSLSAPANMRGQETVRATVSVIVKEILAQLLAKSGCACLSSRAVSSRWLSSIIERCKCRECSVEEALIDMYLAGVSVCREYSGHIEPLRVILEWTCGIFHEFQERRHFAMSKDREILVHLARGESQRHIAGGSACIAQHGC